MARHRSNSTASLLLVATILVTVTLPATADVKLELAVHEAARAARKQGFEKVLLVVREDARSVRDQEIGGVLRTLERVTAEALTLEPRVNPVVSRSVRVKAHSAKARQTVAPAEFAAFRGTLDADAILSLNYQKRRSASVLMTLMDARGVYFSETVRLSGRPEPDDDLFAASMSAVDGDSRAEPTSPAADSDDDSEAKPSTGSKKPGSGNPLKDAAADAKRDFPPASGMVITKDLTGQRQVVRSSPRGRQIQAIIDTLNAEARRATATGARAVGANARQDSQRTAGGRAASEQARSGNAQAEHPANCPCRQTQTASGSGGNGGAGGATLNCPLRNGGTQTAAADSETRGGRGGRAAGNGGTGGAGGAAGGAGNGVAGNTGSQTPAPRPAGNLPQLNEGVLNFATNNIGNRIGRGECWDLADQALRAVGAEPAQGYTFGDRINVNDVIPGDILQFTSARFDEPGYWVVMGVPNHTAVVQAVGQDRLFILQQNFAGKRYVTTYDINPDSMTSGTLEAFRPRLPATRRR